MFLRRVLQGSEETHNSGLVARAVFDLTNRIRRSYRRAPLENNERLMETAYEHSRDMAVRLYFSHVDPDHRAPGDRVELSYPEHYGSVGENIARIESNERIIKTRADVAEMARRLLDDWMSSAGHRQNILNQDWTQLGVGVYVTAHQVLATQLFSRPTVVFDRPFPRRIPAGTEMRASFTLGPDLTAMRALTACIRWPDKSKKFPEPGGGFLVGGQPAAIRRSGTRAIVEFRAPEVPGRYQLLVGQNYGGWPVAKFEVVR